MEKFRDLPYKRPDLKAVMKEFGVKLAAFRKAASFEEADRAFLDFQGLMEKVSTQYVIASIRNTMDMSDKFYDGEIRFYNNEMPKLALQLN